MFMLRIPFNIMYIKYKYGFDLNKFFDSSDEVEKNLVFVTAMFAIRWMNMPEKGKVYGQINNALSIITILMVIFCAVCHVNLPDYHKIK